MVACSAVDVTTAETTTWGRLGFEDGGEDIEEIARVKGIVFESSMKA
jgi:hypothetical protein